MMAAYGRRHPCGAAPHCGLFQIAVQFVEPGWRFSSSPDQPDTKTARDAGRFGIW